MDIEDVQELSVTTPDYISQGSAGKNPSSATPLRKAWSRVTLFWDIYLAGTIILVKIVFSKVIHYIHEILTWKWIFVVSCIAVSLDPLFLYIPMIEGHKCLGIDRNLMMVTVVFRTLIDVTFLTHIIVLVSDWKDSDSHQRQVSYFDSHFEPASGLLWKLKFLKKATDRRMPWLSGTVLIHFLAILPIPQVAILIVFPRVGSSEFFRKTPIINLFLGFQYFPRVCQIYLSSKKLNLTGTWVKGGFNLFLYILASHVIAAYWYFLAIQREISCWHQACEQSSEGCLASYACGGSTSSNITFQNELCPINSPNSTLFDFGIFLDILQSGNAGPVNFLTKFLYSLWLGLKALSFGTNLETSGYWLENCFAILICVVGLLLFLYLVGNVQTYMQFATTKSTTNIDDSRQTRIKAKYRDINKWMSKHGLPPEMKTAIRKDIKDWNIAGRYIDHDVDVRFINNICGGSILSVLSEYLRLNALNKVPVLQNVPEIGLILISQHLYLETYDENAVVARAGKPIDSMFFIIDGVIDWTDDADETAGSSLSSSKSSKQLKNGDYFGQELLSWAAFNYGSSYFSHVPTSTGDAKCRTKVEVLQLSRGTLVNTEVRDYISQNDSNSLADLEELPVPVNYIDQMIDEYPLPKLKWKCPYRGWLKVNCSAVWERESQVAAMAWVCRNDEGAFVAAGSLGGIICMDRFLAQALSIAKAIEFCTTLLQIDDVSGDNVGRIVVESDNQDLMDCLLQLHDEDLVVPKTDLNNSSLEPNNRIGENLRPILGVIYSRLAPGFKAISYVHCDSQCNAAAHCVASHAMNDATESSSWFAPDPAPTWLIPALTKDMIID